MSDIELVIKIPEEIYKDIMIHNGEMREGGKSAYYFEELIQHGTLLPKGHGRIADIDKVLEEMKATRTYDIPFALEKIKPIIEADKVEGEES